ncbi:hypothetical protein Chor_008240, partial [Crotalus horridus]
VNVTSLDQPGTPPLASTQMQIDPGVQEFLLVDLSRHFLMHDAFWTLPKHNRRAPLFLQVDSYGGSLQFTVRYHLGRGQSEPVPKPDVVIVGNGQKLFYRLQMPPDPFVANRRQVHFTEENWQKESGEPVSREELLLSLQNLEALMIQTVYDNRMATVGLSNIVMDTTTTEVTGLGVAHHVEECRGSWYLLLLLRLFSAPLILSFAGAPWATLACPVSGASLTSSECPAALTWASVPAAAATATPPPATPSLATAW